MAETTAIIRLATDALARDEELCLATVVRVEGSSYRKPGARMLVTSGGARAGTISGGCLEAEVAKKAWWLTARGPKLEHYRSFFDEDGGIPYGLGCGGTVWVLIERGDAALAVVEALRRVRGEREAAVVVFALGDRPAIAAVRMAGGERLYAAGDAPEAAIADALEHARSAYATVTGTEEWFVEYVPPPPALCLFGAGDDAQPVVDFALTLGWQVSVADGRSHLARPERFPRATQVRVLESTAAGFALDPLPGPDAMAVLLTHSYEQDQALLLALLPRPLTYLGVLGPRRRTERLIGDLLPRLRQAWPEATAAACLARIRTPVGLDLGGDDPASVALAIVAELQAVLHARSVSVERPGTLARPAPLPLRVDAASD